MQILFTDLYIQNCEDKFKITREQVLQAVRNPDSSQILKFDELELGFFIRRYVQSHKEFFVLVCAKKDGDRWIIELAFKVLPDLFTYTGYQEPFQTLQILAQRFGLNIKIGSQLNKFIMREDIEVDFRINDVTKIIQILNPADHLFIQSMYFRIEESDSRRIVKCALALAIDTDEYLAWLLGRRVDADVIVEIAPQLGGHTAAQDLLVATGTVTFSVNCEDLTSGHGGYLFRVMTKEYRLEVGFTSTHYYIWRNHDKLEIPHNSVTGVGAALFCVAAWAPDELKLILLDQPDTTSCRSDTEEIEEIVKGTHTLKTATVLPPNSLHNWLRKENITPTISYSSQEEVYRVVTSALLSIRDKVLTLGLLNPFWNITYKGATIADKRPKRETDIHPTIHALLFDIAIAKNLEIAPEYPIAGGRLDFLVSAPLRSGQIVSVCIEFKLAHSGNDLLHGLLNQLPAYMRAKGCNYGVYCVLYFKGPNFGEPLGYDAHNLEMHLHTEKNKAGLTNIREVVLDLSEVKPPSKL